MKRILALLLVLLLLFSGMTGCKPADKPDSPEEQEPSVPEQEPSPEGPAEEPMEESAPGPDLLSNKEPLDAAGILWRIPCEILEEQNYQDLYLFGDNLLISRITYNGDPYADSSTRTLHLSLLALKTGEILAEIALEHVSSPTIQICDEIIAVTDWEVGIYWLLDQNLTVLREEASELFWYGSFLSSDGNTMYRLTVDSGISVTNLLTGEETHLLEQLRDVYASETCGDTASFSCVDLSTQFTSYGALDLTTGTVSFLPYDGTFYGVSARDDIWLAALPGGDNTILVGQGDDVCYLDLGTGSADLSAAGDDTYLLVRRGNMHGDIFLTLYDLDGTFLSSAAQPLFREAYCTTPVWSEYFGGYFFTVTTYDGETQLLFWDLSVPMRGESLSSFAPAEKEPESGTAVSQELYTRAAELGDQYGFDIRIAELAYTDYYTYSVEQVLDEQLISDALSMLEDTFSKYPEGFMPQLKHSTYREIEINLCGTLTAKNLPEDANGFTSFIAFVEQQEGKTVMVLDIYEGMALQQHLFHEFSHMIDSKLAFDAMYREDALYSEETWASFNPENFSYEWDYYNLSEGIYWDGYDDWFIDIYARTFPTEDRARILEYAMLGHTFFFDEGTPLRDKLDYYARCIRDSFDTTGWPETTLWEAPLRN